MHEKRFNADHAHRLDHPERLTWLPPLDVIQALAVNPGDVAVDIGAGTGYFALPLAQAVGASGRVIAVDAQDKMLEHLQNKIASTAVSNIELVCAEADQTTLPAATADLVFLSNVWHELPDRTAALAEARRITKARGRIAILDWRPDVEPENGPPLDHRLTPSSAIAELADAGFHAATQSNVGKYSWLVQAVAEI
jgi:ubiquinone/menaquinone biosynthesis C-methylase UbiE